MAGHPFDGNAQRKRKRRERDERAWEGDPSASLFGWLLCNNDNNGVTTTKDGQALGEWQGLGTTTCNDNLDGFFAATTTMGAMTTRDGQALGKKSRSGNYHPQQQQDHRV
jgi:hypothetical protein